jgi:hypothetical protein
MSALSLHVWLHVALCVVVMSIALWPVVLLRWGFFAVPLVVSTGWILCDGCVLSPTLPDGSHANDIVGFLRWVSPRMNECTATRLINTVMVAIPTVIVGRFLYG